MWNANLIPDEAKPGQLIHMSTSGDGRHGRARDCFCERASQREPDPLQPCAMAARTHRRGWDFVVLLEPDLHEERQAGRGVWLLFLRAARS